MDDLLDYNIEYSHIYVNETFSPEQEKGAKLALERVGEFKKLQKTTTLGILIDDYNPQEELLDIPDFLKKLTEIGQRPEYVAMESRLSNFSAEFFTLIEDENIKKEYERYIEKKGKIPCSFLIAVWYFIRLGLIKISEENTPLVKNGNPHSLFVAKNLITILPLRFQGVEEKAKRLMQATKYRSFVDKMEYVFF